MKNRIYTKFKIIIGTLLLVLLVSNSEAQTIETKIKGKWINDKTPGWKWEFKSDGKCYNYYDGTLTKTFSYSIFTENTPSGRTLEFLKMVNINNQNEYIYELDIFNDKLTVVYVKGANQRPMVFTKEFEETLEKEWK